MQLKIDDLTDARIADFLEQHLEDMRAICKHALDLAGLKDPSITFWTAWEGETLLGTAAIKELEPSHGEIKSMRTSAAHRGQGIASSLLNHLIGQAKARGYQRLSLETGSMPFFAPARSLYAKHGFVACDAFAEYRADPNSIFMTKQL